MSTSPSWFDKEKFSRLVKKVGPKNVPESAGAPAGAEPENRPGGAQGSVSAFNLEKARAARPPEEQAQASTAHISLVSRPPSLLSEHRALPALPRRTSPLPALRSLFPSPGSTVTPPPSESSPAPTSSPDISSSAPPDDTEDQEDREDKEDKQDIAPGSQEGGELAVVWQKMSQLNEELAHTILERDQAVNEGALLREQLRQADEEMESREGHAGAPSEDLARITRERDEALAEAKELREKLSKTPEPAKEQDDSAQAKEIALLTEERDQSRREYMKLRGQFETLKQEQQPPREDSTKFRKELEQQVEGFRLKLEERNREIAALKANPASGGGGSSDEATEKFKQEVATLREQLQRAKDEASVAQRGLALSQKALHETRDTLREATEGTSLSRHNFDNLKNECATLLQQNTALQAQNEQLLRDLGAAKSKLTTRL